MPSVKGWIKWITVAAVIAVGTTTAIKSHNRHQLMVTESRGHYTLTDMSGSDGPHADLKPNLQPQPLVLPPWLKTPASPIQPSPPERKPEDMVYTATMLYYFCGDNVAIVDIYTDLLGHVRIRTFTRWNNPDIKWYLKQLARLEMDAANDDMPVFAEELDDRCVKT